VLLRIVALLLTLFIPIGCSTDLIRDRQNLALNGQALISDKETIPAGAELHVLLVESNPNQADAKVISTDSKLVLGVETQVPFSIPYSSHLINNASKYSVRACINVADKVIRMSNKDVPILFPDVPSALAIKLDNEIGAQGAGEKQGFYNGGTILERGVQSNLADVCRPKQPGYDYVVYSQASKILPADLLKGAFHQVREQVDIHGPNYFFVIDSKFGQFTAVGEAMLRKTVREIYAIEELKKITRSEAYLKATADTGIIPFLEVKELFTNPIETLSGIPEGAMMAIATTRQSLTSSRSQYEDSYTQALITVSKYKRRYAGSLGVDVYSSNPMLQIELDRLGWAEALGNWTPSAATLAFSGPGIIVYSGLYWTNTLNRWLIEEAPDFLREKNNRILDKLHISEATITQLLGHQYYSPRHVTILVQALDQLSGARGIELFIQEALKAESEIDALTFQQIAELLVGYDKTKEKIVELFVHKGLPMAYTAQGAVVVAFPIDYFRWTPFGEDLFKDLDLTIEQRKFNVKNKVVWVPGKLSPLAKQNLQARGFKISEDVQNQVEMMDVGVVAEK